MSSLVLDLQQEVLDNKCDILNALRKAHLIASKLQLKSFDIWIQHELNGYGDCPKEEIPNYRKVKGVLKAFNPYNGWIPAQCADDELEQLICEPKLHQPIGELQELYKQSDTGSFIYQFSAGLTQSISSMFDTPVPMQFALSISSHLLLSIVEKVKNALLEWTIQLESEGILGDNMKFNQEEKNIAKSIPQQINNYYGTVVNGDVCESQMISGNNNTNTFNFSAVKDAANEIQESLKTETISEKDKANALELLEEISAKLEKNKKPGVIKAALIGLKDFLVDVGADVTAALITAKIHGLF